MALFAEPLAIVDLVLRSVLAVVDTSGKALRRGGGTALIQGRRVFRGTSNQEER
jgi:hypothetical protein